VEGADAAALGRMDRKRAKRMRNEEGVNPQDEEAQITRLKEGRTALAYKVEQAVDMARRAMVAVTTQGGAKAETEWMVERIAEAVAEQVIERGVHAEGIQEIVADQGYHSKELLGTVKEWGLRSYIAEPERGARSWQGRATEQAVVYGNRRRIGGERGKRLQAARGERVERNFAHPFDAGGLERL
jgi:hypothetical protein